VAAIYRGLVEEGANYVGVIGDLNDTSKSGPLAPLLGGTGLRDASRIRALMMVAIPALTAVQRRQQN
jgi:hypothetical protein